MYLLENLAYCIMDQKNWKSKEILYLQCLNEGEKRQYTIRELI